MTTQRTDLLLTRALFLSLLLSPYICAADSWRIAPANWTHQDVERLLSDSPWALQVDATMDDPADVREDTPAPLPGAAEAGLPGAGVQDGKPRWDGGIGRNRMGHLATIPVTVRWDSANIIQQALEHAHTPGAAALAAASTSDFIITVVGLLPRSQTKSAATIQPRSSSDDNNEDRRAQARSTEETLEWFMANSRLLPKGQAALHPLNVKIDEDDGSVHLFFTRLDELASHKRDVLFVTRFGTMNIQARFRTKDMLVNRKPDL
jgi:hypothetical protein